MTAAPESFNPDTLGFLAELRANNRRDWFNDKKARYERLVKRPSEALARALSEAMAAGYDSPMRAKVFRIHRDIRFSKDKTPYNTHVHLACMDDATGAAWMLGLEPVDGVRATKGSGEPALGRLDLGYGCLVFSKARLEAWRASVVGAGAAQLEAALSQVTSRLDPGCSLRISEPDLKRVPRGFEPDDPGADWLRRKAFCVWIDGLSPNLAMGQCAETKIVAALSALAPLRAWWLAAMVEAT